jgi:hypothetical protein
MKIERRSTRSRCVENTVRKRLWNCRETDYGINELMMNFCCVCVKEIGCVRNVYFNLSVNCVSCMSCLVLVFPKMPLGCTR